MPAVELGLDLPRGMHHQRGRLVAGSPVQRDLEHVGLVDQLERVDPQTPPVEPRAARRVPRVKRVHEEVHPLVVHEVLGQERVATVGRVLGREHQHVVGRHHSVLAGAVRCRWVEHHLLVGHVLLVRAVYPLRKAGDRDQDHLACLLAAARVLRGVEIEQQIEPLRERLQLGRRHRVRLAGIARGGRRLWPPEVPARKQPHPLRAGVLHEGHVAPPIGRRRRIRVLRRRTVDVGGGNVVLEVRAEI